MYLFKFEDINVLMWYTLRKDSELYGGNSKCPEIAEGSEMSFLGLITQLTDLKLLKLTFLVIVGFKYSWKTPNPYTFKANNARITWGMRNIKYIENCYISEGLLRKP